MEAGRFVAVAAIHGKSEGALFLHDVAGFRARLDIPESLDGVLRRGMLDYAADLAQAAADADLFFLVNTFHSFSCPFYQKRRLKIPAERPSWL
jgi:hypothetical protein